MTYTVIISRSFFVIHFTNANTLSRS